MYKKKTMRLLGEPVEASRESERSRASRISRAEAFPVRARRGCDRLGRAIRRLRRTAAAAAAAADDDDEDKDDDDDDDDDDDEDEDDDLIGER
ncbi:hypothetical protein XA68_15903 [Ophiocordyceps unilateralis]|uniref:Uncharacterized protein n=1 Tax=Ophiocordyceps unilateralis TaxID=268505 RepID=A0A2A9PLV4_OPHUN|nr:hypothetical protein XA68_15903 [Ophiocordyceps unilateralis]